MDQPIPTDAEDAVADLRRRIMAKLTYEVCRGPERATSRDWFVATALAVRDRMVERRLASARAAASGGVKRVYYMSLEYLIGRLLFDALGNLGMIDDTRAALAGLGVDLDRIRQEEPDAALGNGGLGRLAACFMESMATLGIHAFGYGIRYDYGLFRQAIVDGWQRELPETWLSFGNPWEFARPEVAYEIGFGGAVTARPEGGHEWRPAETLSAAAYDTPVVGYGGRHANTLRLWSARADTPLRLDEFNRGDHVGALADRVRLEAISRVLYPSDDTTAGQELRLRQEYFFVSASLQDLLRRHISEVGDVASLPEHAAIQLNDTHPAIGIAEMMRLLLDVHRLEWDEAWRITRASFAYTNHTLMPEALEMWPVPLMERLLPRHMQIIYLLNARHLEAVRARGPAPDELLATLSLIDERQGRRVRMGHLAFLGSHTTNGVSALHTELVRRTLFHDLQAAAGGRIVNKTNGIAFRRWLHYANRPLTRLLIDTLGERVLSDADALADLAPHAEDAGFRDEFRARKRLAKDALVRHVRDQLGIVLDPEALFDVHIKRIHEYKRQLLNLLQTVALYDAIRSRPMQGWVPRVKFFAGKAAPGYVVAKRIIHLAHDIARVINSDPVTGGLLKVVFLPNYNVSLAELVIPAADLSEQISTAGMEASGTGNMKFALNGALTIGTLDGANVEIRDRVGADNMFIFGLRAEEVESRRLGGLDAHATVAASPPLTEVMEAVKSGVFSPDDPGRYRDFIDALLARDTYMIAADFDAYAAAQRDVDTIWREPARWWRSSVLNTAGISWFSADRAIRDYAADIWGVPVRPDP
jgi:starch phosphorylase